MKIAVVGAGIAGLTAARGLHERGREVRVFDKSRGPGGRISTRRHGHFAFDHGAQYFTARDPRFRRRVEAWVKAGVAAPWQGRIAALEDRQVTFKENDIERFVGVPKMSSIGRHLARRLYVTFGTRVAAINRRDSRWHLSDEAGASLGRFDTVILAMPPAQASALLANASPRVPETQDLADRLDAVEMRPCWAVMAVFDRPLDLPFDGAFVNSSPLSWIARNSAKPGRSDDECWVLHASPEWSTRHLEDSPETVPDRLLAAFATAIGSPLDAPTFHRAHRWRYSIAASPLDAGCLSDADLRLAVCGDWCSGSRVEGAFVSGLAAADRVVETFRPPRSGSRDSSRAVVPGPLPSSAVSIALPAAP